MYKSNKNNEDLKHFAEGKQLRCFPPSKLCKHFIMYTNIAAMMQHTYYHHRCNYAKVILCTCICASESHVKACLI